MGWAGERLFGWERVHEPRLHDLEPDGPRDEPQRLGVHREAVGGVKKLIAVENNATGQLARLIGNYGFRTDAMILKYDGRPFALDELEARVKEAIG